MSEAKTVDPVRMMLMQSGAQLTLAMTRKGLTPEDVVEAGNNVVQLDKLLRIMTGNEADVKLAEMVFLCTQLGARFVFGVTMSVQMPAPAAPPAADTIVPDPLATAPAPAAPAA